MHSLHGLVGKCHFSLRLRATEPAQIRSLQLTHRFLKRSWVEYPLLQAVVSAAAGDKAGERDYRAEGKAEYDRVLPAYKAYVEETFFDYPKIDEQLPPGNDDDLDLLNDLMQLDMAAYMLSIESSDPDLRKFGYMPRLGAMTMGSDMSSGFSERCNSLGKKTFPVERQSLGEQEGTELVVLRMDKRFMRAMKKERRALRKVEGGDERL